MVGSRYSYLFMVNDGLLNPLLWGGTWGVHLPSPSVLVDAPASQASAGNQRASRINHQPGELSNRTINACVRANGFVDEPPTKNGGYGRDSQTVMDTLCKRWVDDQSHTSCDLPDPGS